ncbi:MAG: CDP-alcohol phosphatidyltransferase family protein [Candidatus Marinimicrobia bacterium]|jgi:CDP-diacylglycerol--glycerol-3-phosphate 3-phosphatidyltransferase|nr:CDP-alcohol phosphatidyltransferase family protein [Candidatus Neomarinimicrobiota bacterium]MBT3630042.1 CDP-alcohol phosphatidyltransferase family protein [Candidatus Neomarinimicrobiota bacterium]MBT3823845.1 CDP-alcohol phosphatidyltransferase family protein [Candidatus Neomarinimicrobiota bacterium]MBT4295509.1 CDP-alcohol phosphatidyltransferase family protein [Candidatus Neomarinimicrobiota bacterium]MBT4418669.1 CDP-alcohol phosphatidyltransferase family protein [Candidatus Neomarini
MATFASMKKFFTAANVTSVVRAFMVFPIVYLLNTWEGGIAEFPLWAIFWIVMAMFSDYLDGWFARSYHEVSRFGKFLDPIADKIVIFGVLFFAKPVAEAVPGWFVAFTIIREVLIFGLGYLVSKDSKRDMQANRTGKWSIFLTSITFILMIFQLDPWADYLLYTTVAIGSISLFFYMKRYYHLYQVDVKKPS